VLRSSPYRELTVAYPLISLESIPPVEPYLTRHRERPGDFGAQMDFAAVLYEREIYYMAMYRPLGSHGLTPPASHDAAWAPYPATAKGREALAARRDLGDLNAPLDLFGLKAEAVAGLQGALRERKRDLAGYLLLGRYALDLGDSDAAITTASVIERLSPNHPLALDYEYDAVARREPLESPGVRSVTRRLRKVLGPDWFRETARAREKHQEQIRRHAWRARTATEGEQFTKFLTTERQWCENARDEAMATIDERLVPESFRELLPLARRYGVGDDSCRGFFINKTPKREQKRDVERATPHLDAIQRWIDTFEPGELPPEATAFFWLLEALEEMR
jgi:hypothetical protein